MSEAIKKETAHSGLIKKVEKVSIRGSKRRGDSFLTWGKLRNIHELRRST